MEFTFYFWLCYCPLLGRAGISGKTIPAASLLPHFPLVDSIVATAADDVRCDLLTYSFRHIEIGKQIMFNVYAC